MMSLNEIFNILQSGGWVMGLLAVLALILYVTACDLLYFVYSGNLGMRSRAKWLGWVMTPESATGQVGGILRYVLMGSVSAKRVQHRFEEVRFETVSRVNDRLVLLNTLVAAAPLAGLLGTVIGMLNTFGALAAGGNESMSRVAGGIHEALLTTQTGLLIALPGVFVSLVIKRRKQALEAALAGLESLTLIHKVGLEGAMTEEEAEEAQGAHSGWGGRGAPREGTRQAPLRKRGPSEKVLVPSEAAAITHDHPGRAANSC